MSNEPIKEPVKELTVQDVMTVMAAKIDELALQVKNYEEKFRHLDQFREDMTAQLDTITNTLHDTKLSTVTPDGKAAAAPVDATAVKGVIDSVAGLIDKGVDIWTKIKAGTMADPLSELKYQYGDRVMKNVFTKEIRKEANNYEDLMVNYHG